VEGLSVLTGLIRQSYTASSSKSVRILSGQFGGPCVTTELVGRVDILFNVDRWLFGFEKEFACPADAEAVVGGLYGAAYFDGIFVNYILVGLCITLFVINIPPEGIEEGG